MVALLAIAAAIMVVRTASVAAFKEGGGSLAALVWESHPAVIFGSGLARIGETAAAGGAVGPGNVDPLIAAARRAPLAPEPFLVRGVQRRLAGDESAAGRAFAEARRRDPRSIPARFFLADHHLRSGAVQPGLLEVAALSRLVPNSAIKLAPILADYAKTPGAVPHVKAMLQSHPELEPNVLWVLAGDGDNADLVLSLASDRPAAGAERPAWQEQLVAGLASSGQYSRAYAMWRRFMGLPASQEAKPYLIDPRFEQAGGLRPFAWSLTSGGGGLVETGRGGLHVIYYGRDTVVLAEQLLLLPPGRYDLAMKVSNGGGGASSLSWAVTCLPSAKPFFTLDLRKVAASSGSAHRFEVPGSGCEAQRFQLVGTAPESPQTVDLSLSGLALTRGAR